MNLPDRPALSNTQRARLQDTIAATREDSSLDLADIVYDTLSIDLSTHFAGRRISHPFGKASGQLSCTERQVEDDITAGLSFVVLKTVIAETGDATRSMGAWAERDTRMNVEERVSGQGETGWTVSWKGRGWHGQLDQYLTLCERAFALGHAAEVPVVPSVKYHLPAHGNPYHLDEYGYTTVALAEVWQRAFGAVPFCIEKDFSPTLAADARAETQENILRWLRDVPALIASAVDIPTVIGVKLMNALWDDAFQRRMIDEVLSGSKRPAYLITFNRLYDTQAAMAFGGFDLSDRNLRVLRSLTRVAPIPLSGTGNICSGRMMLEYAAAGCENGQVHTFFQVPRSEYLEGSGSRSRVALRTLLLHPETGLVPWLWHCEAEGIIEAVDGSLRFVDVIGADHQSD